jgi:hypothetical protein
MAAVTNSTSQTTAQSSSSRASNAIPGQRRLSAPLANRAMSPNSFNVICKKIEEFFRQQCSQLRIYLYAIKELTPLSLSTIQRDIREITAFKEKTAQCANNRQQKEDLLESYLDLSSRVNTFFVEISRHNLQQFVLTRDSQLVAVRRNKFVNECTSVLSVYNQFSYIKSFLQRGSNENTISNPGPSSTSIHTSNIDPFSNRVQIPPPSVAEPNEIEFANRTPFQKQREKSIEAMRECVNEDCIYTDTSRTPPVRESLM